MNPGHQANLGTAVFNTVFTHGVWLCKYQNRILTAY